MDEDVVAQIGVVFRHHQAKRAIGEIAGAEKIFAHAQKNAAVGDVDRRIACIAADETLLGEDIAGRDQTPAQLDLGWHAGIDFERRGRAPNGEGAEPGQNECRCLAHECGPLGYSLIAMDGTYGTAPMSSYSSTVSMPPG